MAIGDILEIRIESIAAGGSALGRDGGRTVFVDFACPGETAAVRVVEERPAFARAELVEILVSGSGRVEPACPLFGRCGGCALQQLGYSAQLAAKSAILGDAFKRIARLDPGGVPEVAASPPYGYRNRMQLHRLPRPKAGGPRVGFKRRGDDAVIPADDCPIADEAIRRALAAGSLVPPPAADRFNVYGRGDLLLSPGGVERGSVEIAGKRLKLDVAGFFQSNASALESLIPDVLAAAATASGDKPALDLYCGVGTFGAFLADRFPRLDLVERDKGSVALARENVRGAGVECFAVSDEQWAKLRRGGYGFVVVDPPRSGLAPALLAYLAERPPEVLAYVSCDPATLARDAGTLANSGFSMESLKGYDFYPQTAHLEALAVFRGPR